MQETLTLNFIPFIDSSIARSTWKSLGVIAAVLLGHFQEVPHWVCDMNRLNVPLLGDVAAALLAGLYEVDHVKSFTNFEVSGLKFALLSFVHFDLDGHGANERDGGRKERTLDPKVFASKRYCGNHATGPCEACMYSAVDEKLIGRLYNCSTFLQTSGHFFQLVQATAEGVRRYMGAPIGNMSPNVLPSRGCLCAAKRFATTASATGTLSTKRRCARTRGAATRSTSCCRIDRAREAEAERMVRKRE